MKNFRTRCALSCAAAMILLVTPAMVAGAWINPPPFDPNQERGRDLEWDFLSPGNWPVPETHYGPIWDSEPDWTCDEVRVTGDVVQLFDDPTGTGRSGLIGIDYRNGKEGDPVKTGSLTFHVNNFDNENPLKVFWDEAEYYGDFDFGVVWPGGCNGDFGIVNPQDLGDGWKRDNASGWIRPNPDWEEFVWNFTVAPGEMKFIDNFRVATLCIPEPSVVVLLVFGAGTLLATLWRRRS